MKSLFVIILLLFAGRSSCQKYFFDHYSTREGLSQNSVYCILQDRDGFIWFGTQAGLDRFDGIDFYHLSATRSDTNSISDGFVNCLYEDTGRGYLWVGTSNGISVIDLKNSNDKDLYVIKRFLLPNKPEQPNILTIKGDANHNVFAISRDNIYFLSGVGDSFELIPQKSIVDFDTTTTHWDLKDLVLFGDNVTGLLISDKGSFLLKYDKKVNMLPVEFTTQNLNQKVNTIVQCGSKFFLGSQSGMYIVDKNDFLTAITKKTKIEAKLLEKTNHINCKKLLFVDSNVIWLGTPFNGIIRYSLPKGEVEDTITRNFQIPKSLSNEYIASLYQSRDKSIWVGTLGGGVDRLIRNKPLFRDYYYYIRDPAFKHDNNVWAILPLDSETILIGTQGNGLVTCSTKSFDMVRYLPSRNNDDANHVRTIQAFNDTILIGTQKGLYWIRKGSLRKGVISQNFSFDHVLATSRINCIKIIGEFVFVGCRYNNQNVVCILNKKLKNVRQIPDNITGNSLSFIRTIVSRFQSKIWVGTDQGIWTIELVAGTFQIKPFKALSSQKISYLFEEGDSLWVGTQDNGLWCVSTKSDTLFHFNDRSNLNDNAIYGILGDPNHNIWFSSNRGITYYNQSKNTFNHYNLKNGLRIDEHNAGAVGEWKSEMFFGGTKGINAFLPNEIQLQNHDHYDILLSQCTSNNSKVKERFIKLNNEINIDPFVDSTILRLRLSDFTDPINNTYKYRINGNSSPWSNEMSSSEPFYIPRHAIHTGWPRYKNSLELIVRTSNGNWDTLNPISVYVPFNIAAEYRRSFQKALVYSICISLLGFFVIVVVVRGSIKKTVQNQKLQIEKDEAESKIKIQELEKEVQLFEREKLQKEKTEAENWKNLQHLINEITRCNDIGTLRSTALNHLVYQSIFNFDFANFWTVSYASCSIFISNSLNKSHKDGGPDDLKREYEGVPLDGSSVRAIAASQDEIISVETTGISIGDESVTNEGGLLHRTSHKFKDLEMPRLIIPVRYKRKDDEHQTSTDSTLALLEVGFQNSSSDYVINKEQKIILKLYADNFAQSYKALLNKEREEILQDILAKSDRESSDDFEKYLKCILVMSGEAIGCSKAFVALLSGNQIRIGPDEICARYNIQDEDLRATTTALDELFAETISNKKYFLSKNLPVGNEFWKNNFALTVPILLNDAVIGCVAIFSDKSNFFDDDNISFFTNVFEATGKVLARKKFHSAIGKLAIPDNILSNPYENLVPIISAIQQYFNTNYVSVWIRDKGDDEPGYKQFRATKKIEKMCESFGTKLKHIQKKSANNTVIKLNTEVANATNEQFWEFANKHGLKSMINVPLKIDQQQFGFINIYSKRDLNKNFLTEGDEKFLKIITSKATFSFLHSKIIDRFAEITQSIHEKDFSLQQLTESAKEILHSDPVILFQFDEGNNIMFDKIIYSGHLYFEEKLFEQSRAKFIEISMRNERDPFYTNKKQLPGKYQDIIEHKPSEDNFWNREKIQSLAAIPLSQNNTLIGFMCFNYRSEQKFPQETRQLIKTFSAFAAAALNNANNVKTIKEQLEKIKQQEELLKEKANRLEYEVEEIYNKIIDILPTLKLESLNEINRSISHDIRNHLIKISQKLIRIERNYGGAFRANEKVALKEVIENVELDINNVTELVKLFEPQSFKKTFEPLFSIVQDTCKLFGYPRISKENNIAFDIQLINEDMPTIRTSKATLAMVFYNLITNARYAIHERNEKFGGKSDIPIGTITIKIDFNEKSKQYLVTVSDDGIGIDNANQTEIFRLGYSTKENGLGIGLYFVQKTIEDAYSGSVNLKKSVANHGTAFELAFKQQN